MPILKFLSTFEAQLTAGLEYGLLGTLAFGLPGPRRQHEKSVVAGAAAFAHFGDGAGMVALQALDVVVDPEAALLAEHF